MASKIERSNIVYPCNKLNDKRDGSPRSKDIIPIIILALVLVNDVFSHKVATKGSARLIEEVNAANNSSEKNIEIIKLDINRPENAFGIATNIKPGPYSRGKFLAKIIGKIARPANMPTIN